MCGITGIISSFKEFREAQVVKMNHAITHRGPDEDGWFSDDLATLAMRRLSIIDLHSGKQPIYNADKSVLVVFNGEIYNYLELKESLIAKGYIFKTESDTEVLVHLYDEFGDKMISKLKGMFAFCIYDIPRKRFLIARDRFGEKPLFYHFSNSVLTFSSEVKSLLENESILRVLNHEVLSYYFTTTTIPEPDTLLKGVYSLQPGHYLVYENEEIKVESYFEVNGSSKYKIIHSMEDAVDIIKPLFEKSVSRQMISDVPLGAFLSGGIDSSAVVAQMQEISKTPISTFNVKFEDASYDESKIARKVAEKLGTDHHEIVMPNATFTEEIFWNIIDHVGFPFVDSSAIPTYYVTKEIKKYVKVALSGDGGDELFGGYPVFDWYTKIAKIPLPKNLANPLHSILSKGINLPVLNGSSGYRQLLKGLSYASKNKAELPFYLHSHFTVEEFNQFSHADFSFDYKKVFSPEVSNWTDLRKIMYYRLKVNLPLDMLVKVDRMSMSNSLEVRTPFLDSDLFEASMRLDDKLLRSKGIGKLVIREMMKDQLPDEVFSHPKSGFSIPLHNYQNEAFKELAYRLLNNKKLASLLPQSVIEETLERGFLTKSDNASISVYQSAHRLWMLMQLSGWLEKFNIEV